MKLAKVLLLLIILEIIALVYWFNIDKSSHYKDIFSDISSDFRHELSFREWQCKNYKEIEVYFSLKKDKKWINIESMSIECSEKSKVSIYDFRVYWHDEYVKFSYMDNHDKTTQIYRIYFKDVEDSYE